MRIRRSGWALAAGVTVAAVVTGGVGTAEAAATTTLVSRNAAGQAGNGHSFFPSITNDGQFVVFRSTSTNLVSGHTAVREVYLLDRVFGHGLEVVSVADDGSPSNGHSGNVTQASRGGLYVVLESVEGLFMRPGFAVGVGGSGPGVGS